MAKAEPSFRKRAPPKSEKNADVPSSGGAAAGRGAAEQDSAALRDVPANRRKALKVRAERPKARFFGSGVIPGRRRNSNEAGQRGSGTFPGFRGKLRFRGAGLLLPGLPVFAAARRARTADRPHPPPQVLGAANVIDNVTSTNDRILLAVITVLAILTRFWKIHEPAQVVFDEVHFGKFASYYLRRTYFFDVHPPLAKLMLAGVGFFLGYDGHYAFDSIGGDYVKENVPYVGLRSLSAALSSFTVPFVYLTLRHSGLAKATASVGAFFVLFGA
ncbi:MAG: Dolichyl-phosphate-mannose-protein mannosyltransferase-domain-containing protein [Olpidium bornovanus]|uniref:Dolichyl-phosphate-mannose-protein mannosyltransferase-domain-containing protein n=1 Tax=Olpidium bornovanus TaxID=278681 RepID=A0A8H7ZXJ4_9FUNG|nr:MAG: Dolichyl-phosphate-mannose-protein mannosyltransferase-domain-containing protein [Olpidium bornovanus]